MLNVSVEKMGSFPVPVKLKIVFDDGSSEVIYKTADIWQNQEKWIFVTEIFKENCRGGFGRTKYSRHK